MGKEIERKFLVNANIVLDTYPFKIMYQGYLSRSPQQNIRIRIADNCGYITIKSGDISTSCRTEYEYEIPVDDAREILDSMCEKPIIEKLRYFVPFMEKTWEIDVFSGENSGLILAEIELTNEDESFPWPPWLDKEVTHDERYYNANLVDNPYINWH